VGEEEGLAAGMAAAAAARGRERRRRRQEEEWGLGEESTRGDWRGKARSTPRGEIFSTAGA
jgi:hypothetical protein